MCVGSRQCSHWVVFVWTATAATKTVDREQSRESLVQLRTASNPQHCCGRRRLVLVSFFKLSFLCMHKCISACVFVSLCICFCVHCCCRPGLFVQNSCLQFVASYLKIIYTASNRKKQQQEGARKERRSMHYIVAVSVVKKNWISCMKTAQNIITVSCSRGHRAKHMF